MKAEKSRSDAFWGFKECNGRTYKTFIIAIPGIVDVKKSLAGYREISSCIYINMSPAQVDECIGLAAENIPFIKGLVERAYIDGRVYMRVYEYADLKELKYSLHNVKEEFIKFLDMIRSGKK